MNYHVHKATFAFEPEATETRHRVAVVVYQNQNVFFL